MKQAYRVTLIITFLTTQATGASFIFEENFDDPNWFTDASSPWSKEGALHDEILVVQFGDGDERLGEAGGSIGSSSGGLSFKYSPATPPFDVLYSGGDKEEVYLDYQMILPPGQYYFEVSLDQLVYWAEAAEPNAQAYAQGQTFYLGDAATMDYGSQLVATIPTGPWQGHSWTQSEDDNRMSEELWNGTCQDKPDIDPKVLGLAFDPATGTLYGTETQSDQLITIHVDSNTGTLGKMTVIGAMGFTDVQGLAFDPDTGYLYGSDIDADVLIQIDPATGQGSVVGSLGFGNVRGLAFDTDTNVLYGADTSDDKLLTINTSTGAATAIGATGYNNVRGLAFDTSTVTNTLYGTDTTTDVLITLATATGAGTTIGPLGLDLVRGLAYASDTDTLYGVTEDTDELIVVDRSTGATTPVAKLTGVLDPVPPIPVDCSTPGAVQGQVGASAYNGLWFARTWDTYKDGNNTILVADRGDGWGEVIFRVTMRDKDNASQQISHAMDNLLITLTSICSDPFADTDEDGDVDQQDFAVWQLCFTGSDDPGGLFDSRRCGCFNRDGGNPPDVDQIDLEAFEACASGPSITADPNCDD